MSPKDSTDNMTDIVIKFNDETMAAINRLSAALEVYNKSQSVSTAIEDTDDRLAIDYLGGEYRNKLIRQNGASSILISALGIAARNLRHRKINPTLKAYKQWLKSDDDRSFCSGLGPKRRKALKEYVLKND